MLEFVVDAEADDVIRARIGFDAVGGLFVVVAVDADEVAGIQANLLVDVPGATQSDAVAVAGEGGVLLVAVGESVVGTLTTATDGELVVDVILHTRQNLMSAMSEFVLTVVGHLGVLIVEEVILESGTELGRELITSSNREQGGHVIAGTDTVLIRSSVATELSLQCHQFSLGTCRVGSHQSSDGGSAKSSIQNIGLVLWVNLRTELIAGSQCERTLMVVDTNHGGEPPSFLIDIKQQLGHLAQLGMILGNDVSAIVAVVIVSAYAYSSERQSRSL